MNLCNTSDTDLHGDPGTRTVPGSGSLVVKIGLGTEISTDGLAGGSAIWLRESVEIINEGSIWGGGGGGAGAYTNGLISHSFPGDGGTPGQSGENAAVLAGTPILSNGGAAGEAVRKESGVTVIWLANHPDGDPGDSGDVLGSI